MSAKSLDECINYCNDVCIGALVLSDNPLMYDYCHERCMEKCLAED